MTTEFLQFLLKVARFQCHYTLADPHHHPLLRLPILEGRRFAGETFLVTSPPAAHDLARYQSCVTCSVFPGRCAARKSCCWREPGIRCLLIRHLAGGCSLNTCSDSRNAAAAASMSNSPDRVSFIWSEEQQKEKELQRTCCD